MPQTHWRYNLEWREGTRALDIELYCIRHGGQWKNASGATLGEGLFHHYKEAQKLLWREDDHHRWSDLTLQTILDNDVTVLMGCSDSNKTYSMVRYGLTDWFAFPDNTLFIVSSTDVRGLELRIWGKMKELFNRAKDRYPDLPGHVLEGMHSITPESIDDKNERGRLLTKGLICIPCVSNNHYVGLGKMIGVKQERLRHLGDEVQHMKSSFLDAYSNWYGKENFKGVMSGNPLDEYDPLGRAAEPPEGWKSKPVPNKTETWRSTFFNAAVVCLYGLDSPNFDYSKDEPTRYPYMIGPKKIEAVIKTHGRDSLHFSSQCEGVMRPGMVASRVITRELCRIHNAHDPVIWKGTARIKLYACDPAYGGYDRCIGMPLEFGLNSDERQVIKVHKPEIIPVTAKSKDTPEDQIARYVRDRTVELGIAATHIFYDSFGKGTIGAAMARVFGFEVPVPVDAGAKPTERPVRYDLFIRDIHNVRRLKKCSEHYSKFVTEMWFSVRECIESDQLFELSEEVMLEGCMREYYTVVGGKIEVEPKDDMRERTERSPDLFDTLAVGVEGARQLGFKILRIGEGVITESGSQSWLSELNAKHHALVQSLRLKVAA